MRRLLPLAFAVLASTACQRDLDLPTVGPPPAVTGVAPNPAFARQLVALTGRGFASRADANRVQFAQASALGEGFDPSGRLLVRVPADAGSGPISVTSNGVAGAPGTSFQYRGLGEPREGRAIGTLSVNVQPVRLLTTASDWFAVSTVLQALVSLSNRWFDGTGATDATAIPGVDAVAWIAPDPSLTGGWRLHRYDVSTDTPSSVAIQASAGARLVGLAGATPQIALLDTKLGHVTLSTWDDGSPPVARVSAAALSLTTLYAAADAGGGKLLVAGTNAAGETLAVVTPVATPTASAIPLPGGVSLYGSGQLLAVVGPTAARRAAVQLDAGNYLRTVDLTSRVWSPTQFRAYGGSRLTSLAGAADTNTILATFEQEDVVLAWNAVTEALLWSRSVLRPTLSGIDGSTALVLNATDNWMDAFDVSGGGSKGRVSFDMLPGNTARPEAGAVWTRTSGSRPSVSLRTNYPVGYLTLDLSSTTSVGTFTFGPAAVISPDPSFPDQMWRVGWDLSDNLVATDALGNQATVSTSATYVYDLVTTPDGAFVAHDDGLTLIRPSATAPAGTSPLSAAAWQSIGLLPDGRIFGVVLEGGVWSVRAWTTSAVAASGTASATFVLPGGAASDGAVVLGGDLWVFCCDGSLIAPGAEKAIRLSTTFQQLEMVDAPYLPERVVGATANGEAFLVARMLSSGASATTSSVLQVYRNDKTAGFPKVTDVAIDGQITGVTWDDTGERLDVVTQQPDGIVVVQ